MLKTLRILPFCWLLLLLSCNDHIANSSEKTRQVDLRVEDLAGRTIYVPDMDGPREVYLSDAPSATLSSAEQTVFHGGEIGRTGAMIEQRHWQLRQEGTLPAIRLGMTDYVVDSLAPPRLFATRKHANDYHVNALVLSLRDRQLTDPNERSAFFTLLNTGAISVALAPTDEGVRHRRPHDELAGIFLYAPEDISSLEFTFNTDGSYRVFSAERIIREGNFTLSGDGLWLVLDGGRRIRDHWRILLADQQQAQLQLLFDLPIALSEYETTYETRAAILTLSAFQGAAAGAE